jgi:hypothetical protein
MKTNKNIITMSCLLTLLGDGAQVFATDESEGNSPNTAIKHDTTRFPAKFLKKFRLKFAANKNEGNSPNTTIKHDTTRLPAEFLKKFRLGECKINESDGNIRIFSCDIAGGEFHELNKAIQDGTVLDFWTAYASKDSNRTVIYLQVGKGIYCYAELFERLIIVRDKESPTDLRHGYRDLIGSFNNFGGLINDDRNIVSKLSESRDLSEAFQNGNVTIYVYHKACNVITSLHFERFDPDVLNIDLKRMLVKRALNHGVKLGKWGLVCGGSMLLKGALGGLPVIGMTGPIIGVVAAYAGLTLLYQTYKLACPMSIKEKVNRFLEEKVDSRVPVLGLARKAFLSLQQ